MESEAQKHFMRFLIGELRATTHQYFAHIVVAHMAEEAGFPFHITLLNALESPEIQKRVEQRFAGLNELVDEMNDLTQDRLIQEYLAKMRFDETQGE